MTIIIAYRARGSHVWSHMFHVKPAAWRAFYAFARAHRSDSEYARVVGGEYVAVLA